MTITFPDVSRWTPNVDLTPYPAVIARSGMSYGQDTSAPLDMHDPTYATYRTRAAGLGKLFLAYHWINHGRGAACAAWAYSITGAGTPMMIDAEDVSGNSGYNGPLTVQDLLDFADEYRRLGGTCSLAYLPHWYWQGHMGSPSLQPLADAGLHLVSSNYTSYSDTGPGWQAYGGLTPVQWQYTSTPYDKNAFRGTIEEYAALVGAVVTVSTPPTPIPVPATNWTEQIVQNLPTLQQGATGGYVSILQGNLYGHGYDVKADGDFGPITHSAVVAFQTSRGLLVDGIVGQHTWTALLTA